MFPDLGSSQQEAALIVGVFLPLLLAIPIQSHWPTSLKTLFSVGCYAGAGALTAAAGGSLTGKSFWQTTLEVLALGVIGYQGIWKPSGIAPAIEKNTNLSTSVAATANPNGGSGGTINPANSPSSAQPLGGLVNSAARVLDQVSGLIATGAVAPTENGGQALGDGGADGKTSTTATTDELSAREGAQSTPT